MSSVAAARRILEEHSPGVILLEEGAVAGDSFETSEAGQSLEAVVAPLAEHAPVVVIGPVEKRGEIAGLIEAGAARTLWSEKRMRLPRRAG